MIPTTILPIGQSGTVKINASLSSGLTGAAAVQSTVSEQPKIYFLSIDGLSPRYLMLGRQGELEPAYDELLMPNVRAFLTEASWFPQARCSLPAATDMNMFGLYSGSWPGTAGIPYVINFFKGWDEEGMPVSSEISSDDLRFGPDGQPVLSIFDVAKDPAYGGDPDTFTALLSGKHQVENLFRTGFETHLDILADGQFLTYYMTESQPYVLGDPISDEDAATDRDGTLLLPLDEYKMHAYGHGLAGDDPSLYPSDRWVVYNALRILAAEDPDIFSIHIGNVDKIQHAAGAAHLPQEWIDPGTPDVLWDDINIYNINANREPVIDIVHEADVCIEKILNVLEMRRVMDESIIVLASDHNGTTFMNHQLNVQALLDAEGLGDAVRSFGAYGNKANVFLWDQDYTEAIETTLENFTMYHSVLQREVNPLVVITQEEMLSGIDSVLGRIGRDGEALRGESYSEWLIDYPVTDNSKVVWPHMCIHTLYRFQILKVSEWPHQLGGHSHMPEMPSLLAIKGPEFAQGIFNVQDTSLVDVVPTLYEILGWRTPGNVDGRVLTEVLHER